jgi:hypothetical protein
MRITIMSRQDRLRGHEFVADIPHGHTQPLPLEKLVVHIKGLHPEIHARIVGQAVSELVLEALHNKEHRL